MKVNTKQTTAGIAAVLATIFTLGAVPAAALAGPPREAYQVAQNRQKTKNDWRNLAGVAGLATIYGLLKHDNTITFLGAAGALYSLNRYEQDRKSQSETSRARAELFRRKSFVRNGHRYDRRVVTKNGVKYYQFVRH